MTAGKAERTNSAISDALVDGATLEWEKYRRFEDLSEDEIKAMSLHSYEQYEKERVEKKCLARLQAGRRKDRRRPCPEGLHQ